MEVSQNRKCWQVKWYTVMWTVLCHHNFRVKASINHLLKVLRIPLTNVCTLQEHSIIYSFTHRTQSPQFNRHYTDIAFDRLLKISNSALCTQIEPPPEAAFFLPQYFKYAFIPACRRHQKSDQISGKLVSAGFLFLRAHNHIWCPYRFFIFQYEWYFTQNVPSCPLFHVVPNLITRN
jgi:hypothetical protein